MNEKNLKKLKNAILSELGCQVGEISPSQQVIDVTDKNGDSYACLIDIRSDKRFHEDIYSFTDDFVRDLKYLNNKSDKGLIIIANGTKLNQLFILNPRNSVVTGFNHHKSYDENGELIHHFIKIRF